MEKVPLGLFLLSGNWQDFPGYTPASSDNFVFSFSSREESDAFAAVWDGRVISLPDGRDIRLEKSNLSEDNGRFQLILSGGSREEIRAIIKRKLQGMPTGHGSYGLHRCAVDHGITCTEDEVIHEADKMFIEGTLMRRYSPEHDQNMYRFTDNSMRYGRQLEPGFIERRPSSYSAQPTTELLRYSPGRETIVDRYYE